ncbi:MAG: hypothetical protein IPP10_14480 [Candidatus Competibacteraceae bacterium]|nr:hypothetical protein [Candidatus Competibacteraceae bacterium]MBK8963370.1 hypothetical protein [Candidatus Competibacteraceae bacterium]MBK9952677.1 hypothetical protein [Candidatus Competibacteraceae bacterium]
MDGKTTVARLLAMEGIDPFLEMARLAKARGTPAATKAALWIQLARYCAPQLRSILVVKPKMPTGKDAVKRAKQAVFGFIDE